MREERGQLAGNVEIKEPYTLWGSIAGKVTAGDGSKFYMRGAIYGDLEVTPGGRVHIFGNIKGKVIVHEDTKVVIGGVIGGDVINQGGRLYIEGTCQVLGKVKTISGKTVIEPTAKASQG